ncbi:MAG: hypothetical protein U9N78_00120 [Actinomycetota bacterium]|nr:hypothetical protein [Actinomycetota bacterium]
MTTVMDTQKENAIKVFYVAVGTPVVTGRKTKDFGSELFTEASISDLGGTSRMVMDFGTQLFMETSIADLEAAGRELGGSIRESNMVGQLQDGVEHIQEAKVIEQIQEKVEIDQFQEKVEILREQLETTLNNWREQFTPGVSAPKPVEEKKAAPKKTAPKKTAAKKTAPKATAKKTAPKKTAPKAAAKKTTTEK